MRGDAHGRAASRCERGQTPTHFTTEIDVSETIVQNVPYIAQKTYETCWLAAYKMMLASQVRQLQHISP